MSANINAQVVVRAHGGRRNHGTTERKEACRKNWKIAPLDGAKSPVPCDFILPFWLKMQRTMLAGVLANVKSM